MKITAINDFDISKFLDGKLFVIIKKKKDLWIVNQRKKEPS